MPSLVFQPYPDRRPYVKKNKGEYNMKRIVILFIVLVMVFAFTIPASAAGNGPGGGNGSGGNGSGGTGTDKGQGQQGTRGTFTMTGTIAAFGTNTVTIEAIRGNRLVQPSLGTQVTLTVSSRTRYLYKDGTTITTIGFADLQVGQQVSVNGTVTNNVWTVSLITVGASLSCLP
jgi:hypothetical protein